MRPTAEPFDPSRYGVEPISDDRTARAFVERHHYSGSLPAARLRLGLYASRPFFAPELVGVVVFSVPMTQTVIPHYAPTLAPSEGIELGRLVLLDEVPANAESWFVARCFRALRLELPEVRLVLSYSDPVRRVAMDGTVVLPGHVGVVYQALNARYVGRARSRWMHVADDGRVVSPRAVSKIRNGEKGADYAYRQLRSMGAPAMAPGEDPGAYTVRALQGFRRCFHSGNHSYLWAFDRRIGLPDALAYPKAAA
jgi:hypothetical protein